MYCNLKRTNIVLGGSVLFVSSVPSLTRAIEGSLKGDSKSK